MKRKGMMMESSLKRRRTKRKKKKARGCTAVSPQSFVESDVM